MHWIVSWIWVLFPKNYSLPFKIKFSQKNGFWSFNEKIPLSSLVFANGCTFQISCFTCHLFQIDSEFHLDKSRTCQNFVNEILRVFFLFFCFCLYCILSDLRYAKNDEVLYSVIDWVDIVRDCQPTRKTRLIYNSNVWTDSISCNLNLTNHP